MNYEFPEITNISQVLPVVKDRPEFVVAERDGFTVINYNVNLSDTFPPIKVSGGSAKMRQERELANRILRECRGITFCSETGVVIARKYHKFFNVNERQETLSENLDLSQPHSIISKLDGSMLTPVLIPKYDRLEWHTKMGNTDVAQPVYDFVKDNPQYENFARAIIACDATPIFEWCSRKQRIVIDHPEDKLILTAIRSNQDGQYVSYGEMTKLADTYNIQVVESHPSTLPLEDLVEAIRSDSSEIEGFVVRFDDGHMIKIKTELYCAIHKAKEKILADRYIVEMILNNTLDYVKPHLPVNDVARLNQFEFLISSAIKNIVSGVNDLYLNKYKDVSKRDYALVHAPHFNGRINALMFKLMDNGDTSKTYDNAIAAIRKCLGKNTNYEELKKDWFYGIEFNTV